MVFTIHRYIFQELLKTFVLATVVLSVILGLGLLLRPLQKFGVEVERVPELLFCFLPITLTMVIPVAALLAATLNYGRLAVQNEIMAFRASGVGPGTLVYPALTLALLVGLATLLLGFHVIPSFAGRIESILKDDAEAIMFRAIEKGGSWGDMLRQYRIHADGVYPEKNLLTGVVVAKLAGGRIEQVYAARQVVVKIEVGKHKNQLVLEMYDGTIIDNEANSKGAFAKDVIAVEIPSLWEDDINFKNLQDLKAIEEDMELFDPIRVMLREVRRQLIVEMFYEWCNEKLVGEAGELRLGSKGTLLQVSAERCELDPPSDKQDRRRASKNKKGVLGGSGEWPIGVNEYVDGQKWKEYRAKKAELTVQDPVKGRHVATMTLKDAVWKYSDEDHEFTPIRTVWKGLAVPQAIVDWAEGVTLDQLLARGNISISQKREASDYLQWLYRQLRERCKSLGVEITVELHSRLGFGVSCVVLVLLGAALGIVFRSGHLLTAFGLSFVPAALCLITLFTGKHIAEQNPDNMYLGVAFLWSGIMATAAANVVIYRRLIKQ